LGRASKKKGLKLSFKNSKAGTGSWHSDLPHELQPPGITHLHNDAIPSIGGDTLWSSGYAAYDKLSPSLQQFLDGKFAYQKSMHAYLDRKDPLNGGKHIVRKQPIVRTHPVTGWKSLYVNRFFTTAIEGLEPGESKAILEYLFDVYEKNLDIQVRFDWRPKVEGLGIGYLRFMG
jgi:alpha-ketoglutarate-dependent taurine dioxygenase